MSIQVVAVNKKHQANVNKVLSWCKKYDLEVNKNDALDKESSPYQEKCYQKAFEFLAELPKREKDNINKSYDITGFIWE